MATRKALDASVIASASIPREELAHPREYDARREVRAVRHALERSAQHFAEQDTIDALAATVRRLIPRWLRALLPVAAIARAVAHFVEKTLDPYADDPKPDA